MPTVSDYLDVKGSVIGIMIGKQRKRLHLQTKQKKYTQSGFIRDEDGDRICCARTLSGIECGELILKDTTVYERLLKKINRIYFTDNAFDNAFLDIVRNLYEVVVEKDYQEAFALKEYLANDFGFGKEDFFYYEVTSLFNLILDYMFSNTMPEKIEKLELYDDIVPFFPDQFRYLYYCLRIEICIRNDESEQKKTELFKMLDNTGIRTELSKLALLRHQYYEKNQISNISNIYHESLMQKSLPYLFEYYVLLCYIAIDTGADPSGYYELALHIANKVNMFPSTKIRKVLINMGSDHVINGRYQDAINCFEQATLQEKDRHIVVPHLVLACYDNLKDTIKIKEVITDLRKNINLYAEANRKIINYYFLKYNGMKSGELLNYIVDELSEVLPMGSINRDLFINELKYLCKETKSYKAFYDFATE